MNFGWTLDELRSAGSRTREVQRKVTPFKITLRYLPYFQSKNKKSNSDQSAIHYFLLNKWIVTIVFYAKSVCISVHCQLLNFVQSFFNHHVYVIATFQCFTEISIFFLIFSKNRHLFQYQRHFMAECQNFFFTLKKKVFQSYLSLNPSVFKIPRRNRKH